MEIYWHKLTGPLWISQTNKSGGPTCNNDIASSDGVTCQNGGTQLNRYTCVCPGGLFGKHCESHLLGKVHLTSNIKYINK